MRFTSGLNALAFAAALSAAALPARADDGTIAYRFTQTGFADGATVSGWFVGRDDEPDGTLLAF